MTNLPLIRINPPARQAWQGDQLLDLARREYDLLELLVDHAGTMVTREQATRDVWGANWFGSAKTVDQHIALLRRKLGDDAADPRYVKTIRGCGWIMHTDVIAERPADDPEALDLATTLRQALAELDARIDARATELAAARIAVAEHQAAERVKAAEDLVAELRRQLAARDQRPTYATNGASR